MPILVLGAILGALLATLLMHLHLLAAGDYINLVVIGMAAYFGAIEKAPFTAICLLTEMVGTMEQILPMLIVTFISYTVNDLLGGRPIYAPFEKKCLAWTKQVSNFSYKATVPTRASNLLALVGIVWLAKFFNPVLDTAQMFRFVGCDFLK